MRLPRSCIPAGFLAYFRQRPVKRGGVILRPMKPDPVTLAIPTADLLFRAERIPSSDPDDIAQIARNLLEAESPLDPDGLGRCVRSELGFFRARLG